VGPRSAGADPGPACYGLGGAEATLTDAFLLCGYLNPERFAGKARLDAAAAAAAIAPLARALELTVAETAGAVVRVALATMYAELSGVLERRGVDPRDFTLVAFGGAGPVVACQLAADVKIPRVLVPLSPGTLCALGALKADIAADFIRSVHWPLAAPVGADLLGAMDALEKLALSWLEGEAPVVERTELRWTADMRYAGQSHEIETELDPGPLREGSGAALAEAFHAAHQRIFNHADPEAAVEMINLRVRVIGQLPRRLERDPEIVESGEATPTGARIIDIDGRRHDAPLFQREALGRGQRLAGPAVVEQSDTTTMIPPGWSAVVDRFGNMVITRDGRR